jgi:hypothetical protein
LIADGDEENAGSENGEGDESEDASDNATGTTGADEAEAPVLLAYSREPKDTRVLSIEEATIAAKKIKPEAAIVTPEPEPEPEVAPEAEVAAEVPSVPEAADEVAEPEVAIAAAPALAAEVDDKPKVVRRGWWQRRTE